MKRLLNLLNLAILIIVNFAACNAGGDLYDPAKAQALRKEEYKLNFVKNFGEVEPGYSWDATSGRAKYQAATRADEGIYKPMTEKEPYYVEESTLRWLKRKLEEGKDNTSLGTAFAMTVPNNKFTIVPIYQGQAGLQWDLYMVVGDNHEKIWRKSEGIEILKEKWSWWGGKEEYWIPLEENGNTLSAKKVRAAQYTFDLTSLAGELMYFYLEITNNKGADKWGNIGDRQSSLDHKMLALTECPRPDNIPEENQVMIIGCEDASKNSDWDLNDIVFLVYGAPDVPKPIEITNEEIEETIAKRYMIEDLGTTDDTDFNDIVVDVEQKCTKKLTITNGVITGTENSNITQTATIRHLGGVLSFRLKIGDTLLDEMKGVLGTNPDEVFEISGWEPDKNNISIMVEGKESQAPIEIIFPNDGDIPMMIAVDPEIPWMKERDSITKEWFDSIRK